MHPRLAFLLLPYTRAELPGWARVMRAFGYGAALGGAERMKPEWKELPTAIVTGKRHGFRMKLDRSDWAQCTTWFLGRYFELGVQRCLDQLLREGDTMVDIGANIGMIALHARSLVGKTGRVICFEPNPECASAVEEHMKLNGIRNVEVRRCALASAPGTLTLNLTSEHSGTATLAPVRGTVVKSIQVPVRVGDDELERVAPKVIKIDVEGFELNVLQGLRKTLAKHKPILITELVDEHLARAGTSTDEIHEFLQEFGYTPYGIDTERSPIRHDVVLRPRAAPSPEFSDWLWK
ncbi:MAG: FkbM family methyltransferase [Caldimonas sp.]